MKKFNQETIDLISKELEKIPAEYSNRNFASEHEGYGVIAEEFKELEDQIFFGRKRAAQGLKPTEFSDREWRERIRKEAIQVAAMAVRIIQEIT